MERTMLGLTVVDRWNSERIRALTKLKDWTKEAIRMKLLWAGRIRGMKDDEWARMATAWIPYNYTNRRGRGHPPIRWRDELTRTIGQNWWSMTCEDYRLAMRRRSIMN